MNCLFCDLVKFAIKENDLAYVIKDKFPVTKGHHLIIPKKHSNDFFELDNEELVAIKDLITDLKEALMKDDESITAFNIMVNVGEDAGQSVFHTHFHLIPRRKGDAVKEEVAKTSKHGILQNLISKS